MKVKKRNYIGYRIRGHITVKAKTREEAEEKFKQLLQEKLEEDYYSFSDRNLTHEMSNKVIIGVEKPVKGDKEPDYMEIRYTNDKSNKNPSRWRKASKSREKKYLKGK